MRVKIKKLHDRARVPTYGSKGAACFDLRAVIDDPLGELSVDRCGVLKVRTGLAFEIPQGHVMNIFARSGNAANYGVTLTNAVGKIDSDYRGEVCVLLSSHLFPMTVRDGDRIAQAEIVPVERVEVFEVVAELSETNRGGGGFGSTGKN